MANNHRQAAVLSVLEIVGISLGLFTFLLLDLILEDADIKFHTVEEYIAKMEVIVSYWWLIPFFILITYCAAYITVIRWEKRGIKKVMYDESLYWLNFTLILFILIDMGWLLMWYLSRMGRIKLSCKNGKLVDCRYFNRHILICAINREKVGKMSSHDKSPMEEEKVTAEMRHAAWQASVAGCG